MQFLHTAVFSIHHLSLIQQYEQTLFEDLTNKQDEMYVAGPASIIRIIGFIGNVKYVNECLFYDAIRETITILFEQSDWLRGLFSKWSLTSNAVYGRSFY